LSRFDALVVDFGGVLTSPLNDAMTRFADEVGIELQDLVRAALRVYTGHEDELVHSFETGAMPEDEFSRRFAERLSELSGKHVVAEGLVERLFAGLVLEEPMFAAVATARIAGLKTALLSNSWGMSLYPRERFSEMFDVVVISGEVGLRKPDPRIYELTTERLAVRPDRCVFVDDHPGHLVAANEAGMTTVLHRDPKRTIEELEELLGLVLT